MAEKKTALDGLKAVVFTFDVPPQGKLHKTRPQVLTTNAEKVKLFEGVGVDYLIECPFTEEIRCMEPEDFLRKTVKSLNVKYLVVGKDFHFGHNRRGDYQMLQSFAGFYGYEVRVVDKMQKDGRDISSTFVREEISRGNIELANELLGYEFFVEGRILHGKHMGNAVLGIPTINLLPPEEKLLPPLGVYVTVTECQGSSYGGITNVGRKPTIGGNFPIGVETHLFDVSKDLYGEEAKVRFLSHVRPEQKFRSLDSLISQMKQDIQYGRAYYENTRRLR